MNYPLTIRTIGTPNIKAQLKNVFTVGADTNPQEVIYMQGSCRSVAWLNYLSVYNEAAGKPFRIHFMDPHDHHFKNEGGREVIVDCEAEIRARETDPRLLEVLKSATIFIHEHYGYYGMFNTNKAAEKNIYQFGMAPKLDICCPNFNDRWILFRDLCRFDPEIRKAVDAEGGKLTDATFEKMKGMGLAALEKFYEVCRLGSFPEMEQHFRDNWQKQRFFWSGNHTSKVFAQYVFRQMNERFLKLPLDKRFWQAVDDIDPLRQPCTHITEYDVKAYGLEWGEQLYPVII